MLVIALSLGITRSAWACEEPRPRQLRRFFGGQSHWIEVEARNIDQIAQEKTVEFWLNFNDIFSSKVLKGNEDMSAPDAVCLSSMAGVLIVKAKGLDVKISKTYYGVKVEVLFFSFHFRPVTELAKK